MKPGCERLDHLLDEIRSTALGCGRNPGEISLVAVSKRQPLDRIRAMIDCGQLLFGENYLQEASAKITALDRPEAEFHFIGHLQSNKARQAARFFSVIQTVDRLKIARLLDRHARELDVRLRALVQVNIGREPQKHGVDPDKTLSLLADIKKETRLSVTGLMCMVPRNPDPEAARGFFRELRLLADRAGREGLFATEAYELSMGMSADFRVAIEEGATMIRVGTALFGPREDKEKSAGGTSPQPAPDRNPRP